MISGPGGPKDHKAIWTISIVGGNLSELADNAIRAVPSPDGTQIAFIRSNEIWLMRANAEAPHRIASAGTGYTFYGVEWSPGGERLADLKAHRGYDEALIESRNLNGELIGVVLSDPLVRSFCWSPDGRIFYTRLDRAGEASANVWELRLDPSTGRVSGPSRRLTNWAGFFLYGLTVTADGKRIAFTRENVQSDVYVGDLEGDGSRLSGSRRLTLDERMDWLGGWSRDSKSLFFFSDRRGKFDIFKQQIGDQTAEEFVVGPEEKRAPQLSPDGSWILYLVWPRMNNAQPHLVGRLMRVAVSGGAPKFVLEVKGYPGSAEGRREGEGELPTSRGYPDFRCPSRPASSCILSEVDKEQIVFFGFDPLGGRQAELARMDVDPTDSSWDLSPDGSRIAFVKSEDNRGRISILDIASRQTQEIEVKGWGHLQSVSWAADGKSFFVSNWGSRGSSLLRVTLTGEIPLVYRLPGDYLERPVPSPNGRHLAFDQLAHTDGNVWMIEGF